MVSLDGKMSVHYKALMFAEALLLRRAYNETDSSSKLAFEFKETGNNVVGMPVLARLAYKRMFLKQGLITKKQ